MDRIAGQKIRWEYVDGYSWEWVIDRTYRDATCNDCGKRFWWRWTELDAEVCDDCAEGVNS